MNLYEAHIPVSNLQKSIKFYCAIVGLELAFEQPQRNVAFLWIGAREKGMLGIWGPGSLYGWQDDNHFKSHFAISISLEKLLATPARLKNLGVKTRGFGRSPGDEPSVIGWMPSAQIYFADPDGHSVEYITVLDEKPEPGFHGTWSEWRARQNKHT